MRCFSRVILTHSRDSILNTTSPSLQKMAADNLRRIGVELMLKERVKSVVDNKVSPPTVDTCNSHSPLSYIGYLGQWD